MEMILGYLMNNKCKGPLEIEYHTREDLQYEYFGVKPGMYLITDKKKLQLAVVFVSNLSYPIVKVHVYYTYHDRSKQPHTQQK
jgi:hypothetical protein